MLAAAGVGAAATVLSACGGSKSSSGTGGTSGNGSSGSAGKGDAKEPLATPSKFQEAPMLAEQVKAGSLPEVAKRLPAVPYVVPHTWTQKGNYGGVLNLNITDTSDGAVPEYFYAHSILRLLNDGITIGPGVAEKWETNADTSVWTFHFRKGLKWSDGHDWSTADIMFWWENMANDADFSGEGVPDEAKSGKGNIAKITAPDELTLEIAFDSPTPLTPAKISSYVNGYRGNGASWMVPSHFVKDFHPKYNPKVPKNWAAVGGLFELNCDYKRNPKCPTLTAWRLSSFSDGRALTWERNPYCYSVTKNGDQLPYIDKLQMRVVADPQVGKVQIVAGKVDYVHGPFVAVSLADVSSLNKSKEKSQIVIELWDSGSGTAAVTFFNLDYKDATYRKLFNEPKFRQAMSLAVNRAEAQKAIYFQQGQLTTGTTGPKGLEFVGTDDGKKVYTDWRDSYVAHDPDQAKKLLDGIGVVAKGGGMRELPGGGQLKLRFDIPAGAADEYMQAAQRIVRDWKLIGVDSTINPVSPASFGPSWANGSYMVHGNWEVSGPPNSLLTNPSWIVPIGTARWAPMQGQMYALRGTPAEKQQLNLDPYKRTPPRVAPIKGGPVEKLWALLDQSKIEPDEMKRTQLFFEMAKIHMTDGPFIQGIVANAPAVIVYKIGLKNVPTRDNLALGGLTNPWGHPTPAVYDPESYYWDKPADHSV